MSEDESVLTRVAAPPQARVRYGDEPDQHALVWPGASGTAAQRPLLLLLHGGFWRPAYDAQHMSPLAAALAGAGWTVANVEYRREPGRPQLTGLDLQLAVSRLPTGISGHDGRVLLAGFSAGGHLALWLAAQRVPCAGVVALAPVADLSRARELQLSSDAVGAFLGAHGVDRWDPALLPSSPMPVRLLHGEADGVVPIELSRRYVARHPRAQLQSLASGHFALIDPLSHAFPAVAEALTAASISR